MIRERGEGPVDGVELRGHRGRAPRPRRARRDRRGPRDRDRPVEPGHLDRPDPRGARHARRAARRRGAGRRGLARSSAAGGQGPDRGVHGVGRVPLTRRRASRVLRRRARRPGRRRAAEDAAGLRDGHADGRRRRARGAWPRDDLRFAEALARERRRDPPRQALRRRQAAPRRDAARGSRRRWPRRWSPTCSSRCAAPSVDDVLVVTGEPARSRSRSATAPTSIADPTSAATRTRRRAGSRGGRARRDARAARPRRLPGAGPARGRRAAGRPPSAPEVSRPDRHGTGTNALVLDPPDAIAPASAPAAASATWTGRARRAWRAGRRAASLMLDVDTAEDLEALREALAREHRRRRPHARDARAARPAVSSPAGAGRRGPARDPRPATTSRR